MVKNEMSITIHRPIEEVFAYVSNQMNSPQWQTGLHEVRRITDGPLGIGSKFASVRKFLGRKLEAIVEITTYEVNRKLVINSPSASVPFEESILLEREGDGTKLTTLIELQTSGFMGLAQPIIASSLKRDMESDFGNLKDLLENQVTSVAS